MQALTTLYNELQKDSIFLESHKVIEHKAATLRMDEDYAIFVDYNKIETLEDEFNVVVHEYGHCASGTTHKICSPLDLISRHEYIANKYSVHKFLPFERYVEACKAGCNECWEFAEYLDLPEKFVRLAHEMYVREGKLY
ncbi:MAG: hypothetical protein BWY15_02487 [Firmicutes bacterium ADurb.Bin193]|nr:MAG: hypothetical protein BWY15_02487 [Firmicutes bacterium ADurb.Bin193]